MLGLPEQYRTVSLLPTAGTALPAPIHFLLVNVLPSTEYCTLMICGNTAPSRAPIRIGFVFTFSHHCIATETTVPIVSLSIHFHAFSNSSPFDTQFYHAYPIDSSPGIHSRGLHYLYHSAAWPTATPPRHSQPGLALSVHPFLQYFSKSISKAAPVDRLRRGDVYPADDAAVLHDIHAAHDIALAHRRR